MIWLIPVALAGALLIIAAMPKVPRRQPQPVCPVRGCWRRCAKNWPVCSTCWYQLPVCLRDQLLVPLQQGPGTPAWQAAAAELHAHLDRSN